MKKMYPVLAFILLLMCFLNCKETAKKEAISNKTEVKLTSKVTDTIRNHIYIEIDNKKYDFSYNEDNFAVFLTSSYGKSEIFLEFTKEIIFVPDPENNRLNAVFDTDYKMDIRNINFSDNIVTFDAYKDDIFLKKNKIIISQNISKTDFFDSLDSGFLLDGNTIHKKLKNNSCPACVVLVTILATTVVGDSKGSNKELCEQQNNLIAENCANKPDFCLVSEGPCKLKCVPCSDL